MDSQYGQRGARHAVAGTVQSPRRHSVHWKRPQTDQDSTRVASGCDDTVPRDSIGDRAGACVAEMRESEAQGACEGKAHCPCFSVGSHCRALFREAVAPLGRAGASCRYCGPYGGYRGDNWREFKNGYRVASCLHIIGPGIAPFSLRMVRQVEYLNIAFPNCLALEGFAHRHPLNVLGIAAVRGLNGLGEMREVLRPIHKQFR